ncbi:MAG: c-type cytochrome [Bacteroidia bacterium]
MRITPTYLFILLCAGFLVYSFTIYIKPSQQIKTQQFDASIAAEGKLIWQKYNCQSCHQLYGLGGYLGPDLTNVYSKKNETIIKGIVGSGVRSMPAFQIPDDEFTKLLEFLKQTDASGNADYRNYNVLPNGMIEMQ